MDEGDPVPDAEDYPVQVLQPIKLGRGGDADGAEVHGWECKNGVSKIYGRKLIFVRFVHTVQFQNAIVYAERSG